MSQSTSCKVGNYEYLLADFELAKTLAKYSTSKSSEIRGTALDGELDARVFTQFLADVNAIAPNVARDSAASKVKELSAAETMQYKWRLQSLARIQSNFYWHMHVLVANAVAHKCDNFRVAIYQQLTYWGNLFALALIQELPNVQQPKQKERKDERTGFLTTDTGDCIFRSSYGEIELLE